MSTPATAPTGQTHPADSLLTSTLHAVLAELHRGGVAVGDGQTLVIYDERYCLWIQLERGWKDFCEQARARAEVKTAKETAALAGSVAALLASSAASSCTTLHQPASSCTTLHQPAPSCTTAPAPLPAPLPAGPVHLSPLERQILAVATSEPQTAKRLASLAGRRLNTHFRESLRLLCRAGLMVHLPAEGYRKVQGTH